VKGTVKLLLIDNLNSTQRLSVSAILRTPGFVRGVAVGQPAVLPQLQAKVEHRVSCINSSW